MTVVTGTFTVPSLNGNVGASGYLIWVPTGRYTGAGSTIIPEPFTAPLDSTGAMAQVNVDPTGATWCWKVTEQFAGIAPPNIRYVQVPATGPVAYKDLLDVDPTTLSPAAAPVGILDAGTASSLLRKIQIRHDTAADWMAANPVLGQGEMGIETDTGRCKLGDGTTAWASLPYRADTDTDITALVNNAASGVRGALDGRYAKVYNGALVSQMKTDGTDQTATLNSELQSLYNAGGGTYYLPAGTVLINGQVTLPNNGGTALYQPPLRIVGAGARQDGQWAGLNNATGGSVLDLRYQGTGAKIVTLGRGLLAMDNVTLADNGTGNTTPFLLTTNTTLKVRDCSFSGNPGYSQSTCAQDAIVLGATGSTASGNTSSAAFQGYGTIIEGCTFSRIRRGILGNTWANSVVIRDNTWDLTCGAPDGTAAAIEFAPTSGSGLFCNGNVISGNLIEMKGYVYGIRFSVACSNNMMVANSFWDWNAGTTLAGVRYETGATANYVHGYHSDGTPMVSDASGTASNLVWSGTIAGNITFSGGVTFSASETAGAGLNISSGGTLSHQDDGSTVSGILARFGSGAGIGYWTIQNAGGTTSRRQILGYNSSGTQTISLDPQVGPNFTGVALRVNSSTTAARLAVPAASGTAYDSTLSQPIYSDGTHWRDAAGIITPLATKTTSYTAVDGDGVLVMNGASLTLTLPDPTTVIAGRTRFTVKNVNSSALTVVSAGTSKTIDGAASQSLAQWGHAQYVSDGTQWLVVG